MTERKYDETVSQLLQAVRQFKTVDNMSVKETAQALLALGESLHDVYLQGVANYALCIDCYLMSGRIEEVYELAQRGIELQKLAGDSDTLTRSYIIMGVVFGMHGSHSLAMDYYMTALQYSSDSSDPEWYRGVIMTDIAISYHDAHANDAALAMMLEAIELTKGRTDSPNYVNNVITQNALCGHWYLDTANDIEKAQEHLKAAQDLYAREGDPGDVSSLFGVPCLELHIAMHKKQFDAVGRLATQLVSYLETTYINADMVSNVEGLMNLLLKIQNFALAGKLIEVIERSMGKEAEIMMIPLMRLKVEYYKASGMIEMAQKTALECYEIVRKMQEEDFKASQISMNARMDLERINIENRKLRHSAETDPLTGLPNRYSLNRYSDELFELCYREKKSLAVEILDIDFFKEYNDTYGHLAGDECLRCIGEAVKQLCNESPSLFAARYGGDEIVMLYENMTDEEITSYAQKLAALVREKEIAHTGSKISPYVTVSQGIFNAVPRDKMRLWDIMSGADQALYHVKRNGKGEIYLTGADTQ